MPTAPLTDPKPAGDACQTQGRAVERVNEHLKALPALLAAANLAVSSLECRDARTGALIGYGFATIHRGLALQVAEAVRASLARFEAELGGSPPSVPAHAESGGRGGRTADDRPHPGQYL
jgi:hypothetical protein